MRRFFLRIVCADCMHTYDTELHNAVMSADGTRVEGVAGSASDFCEHCNSDAVETLGVVEYAS
jgi:hypothetical protein